MNVQDLLDAAKSGTGITSDYALSVRLKVTKQAVSKWRLGQAAPDPVTCEKLAIFSGIPLHKVLGIVGEARAISEPEKRVWRKLAAAMFVSLVVVALPASASNFPTNGQSACTLCEVARRLRRDVARHFATLARRFGDRHAPLPAL